NNSCSRRTPVDSRGKSRWNDNERAERHAALSWWANAPKSANHSLVANDQQSARIDRGIRHAHCDPALALFPGAKDILHCPSGTIEGVPGVTVDKVRDAVRCPQIIADACALPFSGNSFDLILSDPPYSDEDAEKYGTGHFPLRKAMQEFHRVLRPHGHLALLHVMAPSFSTKVWKWVGMIGVLTGTNSRMRVLSIFECLKP
ncbi:MAG: methyltransferase domain-containing protein, partial [Candidatus Acidiferrales bacterium]